MKPTVDSRDDELPPPFGDWKRFYALVLVELAILVALFYGITIFFR